MAGSKKGPKVGAQPGKVKGTGTVTPSAQKASSEEPKAPEAEESVQAGPAPVDNAVNTGDNGASKDEHPEAYEAGWQASLHGTRNRPPLEYSDDEVRAWYRGYKAHANPNAETPVADIQAGYRQDY